MPKSLPNRRPRWGPNDYPKSPAASAGRDEPCRLLEAVPALSCEAKDKAVGENLIVQGDDIDALKALLPRYRGQVKCIYVEPPCNTGSVGVGNDDGVALDRHGRWLRVMYPRLALLQRFMRDDGIMFVSIADDELHPLRCLAEEIGQLSLVGCIAWQRNRTGSRPSKTLARKAEYIVVLGGRCSDIELLDDDVGEYEDFPLAKRTNAMTTLRIQAGYLGPTHLPDGAYPQGRYGKGGTAVDLLATASVENGRFTSDIRLRGPFSWTQSNLDDQMRAGGRCFLRTKNLSLRAAKGRKRQGRRALDSVPAKAVGTNEDASSELADILGVDQGATFRHSKPASLIQVLVRAATHADKHAVVLDSCAGPGATAHAVLKQNAEDGGHRRFVLVEPDDHIVRNITVERVRRVMHGYTSAKNGQVDGLGGGFRFCRLSKEPPSGSRGLVR